MHQSSLYKSIWRNTNNFSISILSHSGFIHVLYNFIIHDSFFPPLLPSNLGENCFNLCCMIWKVSLILNLDSYPTSVMLTWDEFRTSRTCGCEVTFVSLYTHLSFFYAEYSGLTKRKQRRWIHLSEVNFRASAKSWKSTWLYIYIDIDTDNLGPPLWHNWTSQALHSSSFFFFGFPHPRCFPLKAQILSLTISQSVITGLLLLVLRCRYKCSSNFIFSLIVRRLLSLTRYVSVSSRGCCLWQYDYLCHGRITEFLWES